MCLDAFPFKENTMKENIVNVSDIKNFKDLPAKVQEELSSYPLYRSDDDDWEDVVGFDAKKQLYVLVCIGSWDAEGKYEIEKYTSFSLTRWEAA